MKMINVFVMWFDRNPDFTPDYSREHHKTFTGETPSEVMRMINAFKENHDLAMYTQAEMVYMW